MRSGTLPSQSVGGQYSMLLAGYVYSADSTLLAGLHIVLVTKVYATAQRRLDTIFAGHVICTQMHDYKASLWPYPM